MTMSAPQLSVFTFESTVHSSHVLRCLDEQRLQDMLCDVTVVVEGQSFRAHRSVLASCSEYFTRRISSLTHYGAVITLPQEVTAAGFEPLLKFAYTSKLLFRKDDVIEISNSASILGFRDLDEACFDFLLPKFFNSSKSSGPFQKKNCCKKKCKRRLAKEELGTITDDVIFDKKEVKPVADSSSQQEVDWLCNMSMNSEMESKNNTGTPTPVVEGTNDHFMKCPKYRRQLACEEVDHPRNSTSNVTRQTKGAADDQWNTEIYIKKTEAGEDMIKKAANERQEKWSEKGNKMDKEEDISFSDESSTKPSTLGSSMGLREGPSSLTLHLCHLKALGESPALTGSLGHERFNMDITEDRKIRRTDVQVPVSILQKAEELVECKEKRAEEEIESGWFERGKGGKPSSMEHSSMDGVALAEYDDNKRNTQERGVAEHLAKTPGSDVNLSQLSFQDPDPGSSSDTGSGHAQSTPLEWLNFNLNHSSKRSTCPFFQDFNQNKCLGKGAELSECEGASHSGVSSLTSGEDGDSGTETEGDSESYTRERARQVQLPFSVDWVVDLSRNDFQQLLKQHIFTREQLEFVHDMRRRCKNRQAAQRCRKRKLDCIYNLQFEINKLKAEREKLIMEKSQLGQLKLKTSHSVSALCQRVCNEASLQPEQLKVLAKYTSPECPLSSVFPHIDSTLSQHGLLPQVRDTRSSCSVGLDKHILSEEGPANCSGDTVTADGQHSL